MTEACELLSYGMDCRIQSHEVEPPGPDRNFQTLTLTMGYALKDSRDHKPLLRGNCARVIAIDFSFDEQNYQVDTVQLVVEGGHVKVYSLVDQVAEKYRAIIQQPSRHRSRRQDAYDIYSLLVKGFLNMDDYGDSILRSLVEKSSSRDIHVEKHSLRNKEVIDSSSSEYETHASEISEELPPFEQVYDKVRSFYESLPWDLRLGNRKGQWNIRINDQWRICFEWINGNAENVEIRDYH